MASSPETSPRMRGIRQFSMHVPTRHLPMTFWQRGASIWALEKEGSRRSPLFAMNSGWPKNCFYRSMQAKSGTLRSDLAQLALRDRRDDAAKGLNA